MLVNNLADLINIYKSGEKVKVSYDKDTRLGDVCSIMLSGGYEPEDFKEEYLVEGFSLIGESLYVKANCLITIDSISVDEGLGVLKPFKGGLEFLEVLYPLDRLIDNARVVREEL